VAFDPLPASIEHIRAGKLRALGVTTAKRSEAVPDIASVGEYVSGYAASNWYGFAAPSKTPADIISRLNSEINAALADPKIKAHLSNWAARHSQIHRQTSRSSWQTTQRNGRR
jgi:tripartite-type tricarboxylate transporter receptor subunit TctC